MAEETENVPSRIRRYVMEQFPLARKQANLADDCPLLESGIIDSLGVLDLIGFFESEFALAIADEDLRPENFESIASMAAFVERKGGAT